MLHMLWKCVSRPLQTWDKTLKRELETKIGSCSSLSRSHNSCFKILWMDFTRFMKGFLVDECQNNSSFRFPGLCNLDNVLRELPVLSVCKRNNPETPMELNLLMEKKCKEYESNKSFKRWVWKRASEHPRGVSSSPGLPVEEHNITCGVSATSGHPNWDEDLRSVAWRRLPIQKEPRPTSAGSWVNLPTLPKIWDEFHEHLKHPMILEMTTQMIHGRKIPSWKAPGRSPALRLSPPSYFWDNDSGIN